MGAPWDDLAGRSRTFYHARFDCTHGHTSTTWPWADLRRFWKERYHVKENCRSQSGQSSLFKIIERGTLLSLWRYAYKPRASVIGNLKALGILKYRGRRGGKKAKHNASLERHPKSIQVVESRRPSKTYKQRFEHGNLICIQRENNSTRISPSTEFAVLKCLFTNICGLAKSKNRLWAPVAIEVHLNNQDIDICVVSETHLSTDLPDSIVNIPENNLFRRDRGWLGRDWRKNGGIAIYMKKNPKVWNIYHSSLYELICVTLLLPSGHRFLICGFYNPPKHQYRNIRLHWLYN